MPINPPVSERELRNAKIACHAATQGMVLLKNDNQALPLAAGKIALFGNGAARTIRGGSGSGDPFNGGLSGGGAADVDQSPRYHINLLDAFQAGGYQVVNSGQLLSYAEKYDANRRSQKDLVMSVFAYPEEALTETQTAQYAQETDTAVYVISRGSGEGSDRSMVSTVNVDGMDHEVGDYQLCQTEKDNLKLLRQTFSKLILLLNVGGPISGGDILECGPDGILLMGQAGQEGGTATVQVVSGQVNPSGKLTATWCKNYEDYPSAKAFLADPDTALYPEGVYVGYRYFDTFGIQPAFPFGFGLSYTSFALSELSAAIEGETLNVTVRVANTGICAGREVVQVYASAPDSQLNMPAQILAGYKKTALLAPGESELVTVLVSLRRLASYNEEQEAYQLFQGDYRVSLGTSSRSTLPLCVVRAGETVTVEQVRTQLPLDRELKELAPGVPNPVGPEWSGVPVLPLPAMTKTVWQEECAKEPVTTYTTDPEYQAVMPYETVERVPDEPVTFQDVLAGKAKMGQLLARLSPEQLADLCCGTGWGVADENSPVVGESSESVPGAAGETTHQLEEPFGVPSIVVADGPAGVRVTQAFEAEDLVSGGKRMVYHYCTAWPVGTLLAQSFDPEVVEEVGRGISEELKELNIAVLLGPGINIQRNPLCGRNFEYYSEDPLLTGTIAAAMVRGIQALPGAGACIKHYAANNQETNRNTVNSVVGQRALREIYLEPFRIAIRESDPMTIMTSYNLINGVPSADSYDLCTGVARGECGFRGLIMTDWNGGSSTPSISMHAGNDLIMPGGKSKMLNILKAVTVVEPKFDERGQVLMERDVPFISVGTPRWNSFELDPAGKDQIAAKISEGHSAEVKDGHIFVDGELLVSGIRMDAEGMKQLFTTGKPIWIPVGTDVAALSPDGKEVLYRGNLHTQPSLCLGDVQKSAAAVLGVIARTLAET